MVLVPIRADNSYIGLAKQAAQGAAVAPTYFPRILDGSTFEVDLAAGELWEMDGSRHVSQLIKNKQMVKFKQVVTPRMNELALLEQATMGHGSDTISLATTLSGTLHTALTANSSTAIVVTGAGFSIYATPAAGTLYLTITDPTNGNETIPCTLAATGSASTWTFTIASTYNSGKPMLSHAGSDALTIAVTPASGTLNGAITANSSTTVVVTAPVMSAFLTPATGNIYLMITDPTNGNEIIPCTLPATGTNPYTFTIASTYNGSTGTAITSHAGSDVLAVSVLTVVSTSLTSAAAKGATTISLGSNSNLIAASTQALILSPGTSREEIVTVTTPKTSGTGPWVFTLAASATLKNAHNSGDLVYSPVVHTMIDESDGDYYTLEVGLGSLAGAGGMTIRVRDCKVETCKVSGKAGSELQYELEWMGIACSVQNSPATLTFEAHPVFLYTQGVWTLDGSLTGEALNIEQFSIDRKNNLDEVQTEQLVPAAYIFGNMAVDVAFDSVFVNGSRFFLVYFGSTSGTADSQTIGAGSFLVTFSQPDGFESVQYSIPVQQYSKVGGIEPKKDGKHYKQAVSAIGVSNAGANVYIMQTTVSNSTISQY
jgi:hypothetical protein